MEHDNRKEQIEEQNTQPETEISTEETTTALKDLKEKIKSKISDLRELQHEVNPHKKFDLIEQWMGSIEDFSIYENANREEVLEVLELMENLKDFVNEYSQVLYAERGKIKKVATYIK